MPAAPRIEAIEQVAGDGIRACGDQAGVLAPAYARASTVAARRTAAMMTHLPVALMALPANESGPMGRARRGSARPRRGRRPVIVAMRRVWLDDCLPGARYPRALFVLRSDSRWRASPRLEKPLARSGCRRRLLRDSRCRPVRARAGARSPCTSPPRSRSTRLKPAPMSCGRARGGGLRGGDAEIAPPYNFRLPRSARPPAEKRNWSI